MSMASEQAARAHEQAASAFNNYNLKLGPTVWWFGAGLLAEYNNNINLTANGSEDDFLFRPQINARMLWPMTDKNSLNLNIGVGYSAYVQHSELNKVYIPQGSELSFDLYAGDFRINLHDRFSITEGAYEDPTVSGTGDYVRLENAVGATALWDLNKVIVRFGYDHVDFLSLSTHGNQPDAWSELFSSSASYAIKPGLSAGLQLGGGLLNYSGTNTPFSKSTQWSLGPFFETQISEHIHFRGSVGYIVYSPESSGTTAAGSDFTGVYAQIAISHRLNGYVNYTVSGGRSLNFGFYGGTVDMYYARLRASWNVIQKVSIDTSFDFEHGTQVSSGNETFDRYGAGITFGRAITSKLDGSLGYRFFWRQSDLAGKNYSASIVSLNLNYAF